MLLESHEAFAAVKEYYEQGNLPSIGKVKACGVHKHVELITMNLTSMSR